MRASRSRRDQRSIVFAAGLGLVVLGVYVRYIIRPLRRAAAESSQKVVVAAEQLRLLEAATRNDAVLREQYGQVEQSVLSWRKRLPDERELASVIEVLSDLANQAQVKIQTISPQRPADKPEGARSAQSEQAAASKATVYKEVLIQIDAMAGYHQIGSFLALVESENRPLRIASLRISVNTKEFRRHHMKLVIRSYFSVDEGAGSGEPAARAVGT